MTGLSISLCIRDIIEGKVKEEEVTKIIAGTKVDDGNWNPVKDYYGQSYWNKNPKKGKKILDRFLAKGIIEQPRVDGKMAHVVCDGWWVKEE